MWESSRQAFGASVVTIIIACACNGGEEAKPDNSSALLLNWKHSQRITLDMEKAHLEKVFKEIKRQSGVKIGNGTQAAPPITLKVKDVPIWQALAEASVACRTGLELGSQVLDRGSRSVEFKGDAWFPPNPGRACLIGTRLLARS